MKNILCPSMLAADFNRLGEEIRAVEAAGASWLHIDVMDGQFVPSISFGMPVIHSIRKESSLIFDVHMMVVEPSRFVQALREAGADRVTVHLEACRDLRGTIAGIREAGMGVGVAINPGTPPEALDEVLELTDMVLVMTVNPGFGSQKMIPACLDKIRRVADMRKERGLSFHIQADGGINDATLPLILEAGANCIVSGSSLFGVDTRGRTEAMRKTLEEYERR